MRENSSILLTKLDLLYCRLQNMLFDLCYTNPVADHITHAVSLNISKHKTHLRVPGHCIITVPQ